MQLALLGRWDETGRWGRTDVNSVYYTSVFLWPRLSAAEAL